MGTAISASGPPAKSSRPLTWGAGLWGFPTGWPFPVGSFISGAPNRVLEGRIPAGRRRHAEVENAIRDFKYGVGLNHLPSGRFAANAAWLAVQVIAHNLARWTARIGLGEPTVTTKTLRRRVFALVGRITRSARRLTLHLSQRWPWETQFTRAMARLRAIPLPA